jgi:Transposase DDE domain
MVAETEGARPWTFEDFCLWTYCLVDDLWPRVAPLCARPGPAPRCSDPELVTMALVGEAKGWHEETVLLSEWARHRDLIPHQPSRTRFNRRRRQLAGPLNQLRRLVLQALDLAADGQCVLDSVPVPVIGFHLVPDNARGYWQAHEARFGDVASKKQWVFGYKLYLLVTLSGVVLDFVLAPANVVEVQAGTELLEEHAGRTVLGDKAFVSRPLAARLRAENALRLLVLPRRNQRVRVPRAARRLLNRARQVAETVNGQLAEQFGVETNHAQSFGGLVARLYAKLAAHTLSVYVNRLLGKADILRIKDLAFPRPN